MTGSVSPLPGFEYRKLDVEGVVVNYAMAGTGPPLLLLHGYPQNHLMWRHVAPVLAEDHTVVVSDLRGYGDSGKPAPDAEGLVYCKRSMAHDQLGLMRQLGFPEFELIGHDRGARVAHRLVLDHPAAVRRLAVLDIVPTRHVFGHVTRAMATAYHHWFFLSTGHGIPERLIGADPGFWVRSLIAAGQRIERPVLACGAPRRSSAAATSRSTSGGSTLPTSAATPCPPATSSPKKPPTWSSRPCVSSSASRSRLSG